MCYACYEKYGSPVIVNDKTKRAAALVSKVYEHSCSGGNAHIVVDDWNLENDHIIWCLGVGMTENAHEADDEQINAEQACLEALLDMTMEERASAMALHDGFIDANGQPA